MAMTMAMAMAMTMALALAMAMALALAMAMAMALAMALAMTMAMAEVNQTNPMQRTIEQKITAEYVDKFSDVWDAGKDYYELLDCGRHAIQLALKRERERVGKVIDDLKEQLADIEHQRWADWQKYLHSKMSSVIHPEVNNYEGKFLSDEDFEHWERQIATDYKDLSEKEKDSDREQVDRYLPLIKQALCKK